MIYPDWAGYFVQLTPETAEALGDIWAWTCFQTGIGVMHAGEGVLVLNDKAVTYLCRVPEELDGAVFDTPEGLVMRADQVYYPVTRIFPQGETHNESDDDSGEVAGPEGGDP
jgi:hypothetical protein